MSYYETLGVAPDADADALKKAFREKAIEQHPDKTGGNEDAMKELNHAYGILSDPAARAKYDQFGESGESDLRNKAESELAGALCGLIGQQDLKHQDALNIIRDRINRHIPQVKRAIEAANLEADAYRDAAQRLVVKNPVDGQKSLLQMSLEHAVEVAEGKRKAALYEIAKDEEALKILDEYEWRHEPLPTPQYPTWSMMMRSV